MAEKKFVTIASGGMDTRLVAFDEANIPTSDQKAALAGTSGAPSGTNKYVTDVDARLLAAGPVGSVIVYADDAVPSGYLECNGAAISRTTYAALFAIVGITWGAGDESTTFNIPDFRGEFLRGWDHSRGVDSGRTFASYQSDALQGHTHLISTRQNGTGGTASVQRNGNGTDELITDVPFQNGYGNDGAHGTPRIASETRPRNKAVLFAIKY